MYIIFLLYRLDQYRADILCILLRVKELLYALSPNHLELSEPSSPKLSLIHTKVIFYILMQTNNLSKWKN